jgi:hypothetical protein
MVGAMVKNMTLRALSDGNDAPPGVAHPISASYRVEIRWTPFQLSRKILARLTGTSSVGVRCLTPTYGLAQTVNQDIGINEFTGH